MDLISVPPLTKSMRIKYQLISTNLLDFFELKSISWPKRETADVDGSADDNEIPLPRFKKKSSWIPKPSKNTTLESFIDLVKNDVQTAASTNIHVPTHNNLTPAEKGALQELKEREDIVIKSADKG